MFGRRTATEICLVSDPAPEVEVRGNKATARAKSVLTTGGRFSDRKARRACLHTHHTHTPRDTPETCKRIASSERAFSSSFRALPAWSGVGGWLAGHTCVKNARAGKGARVGTGTCRKR